MWKPVDIIAGIFTVTLCAVVGMAAYSIAILGTEIPDNRRQIIEVMVNGAISIVSMWVGAKIQERADRNE